MTKHEPAFPCNVIVTKDGIPCGTDSFKGLTKYEEVAARFMAQRLITGPDTFHFVEGKRAWTWTEEAFDACNAADAFFSFSAASSRSSAAALYRPELCALSATGRESTHDHFRSNR